jgi:hypothetical protein
MTARLEARRRFARSGDPACMTCFLLGHLIPSTVGAHDQRRSSSHPSRRFAPAILNVG